MSRRIARWPVVAGLMIATAAGTALAPQEVQAPPASQPATSQPATSRPSPFARRESEAEVLAVLKDRLPLRYQRLIELKESSPQEYTRHLNRMRRWYGYWKRMPTAIQDADVLQQTMSVRIWQLVEQMRQAAPEAARPALEQQLTEAVAKQFEAETVVMAYRLEMLERALARVREHLAERREKRDALLAERVEELLRATTQPAGQWPPPGRREPALERPRPPRDASRPDDRPPPDEPGPP